LGTGRYVSACYGNSLARRHAGRASNSAHASTEYGSGKGLSTLPSLPATTTSLTATMLTNSLSARSYQWRLCPHPRASWSGKTWQRYLHRNLLDSGTQQRIKLLSQTQCGAHASRLWPGLPPPFGHQTFKQLPLYLIHNILYIDRKKTKSLAFVVSC